AGGSKAGCQAAAVDVQGFEDLQDCLHRQAPFLSPDNDVQVLLAFFETVEDAIEEERFVDKAALEEAEVTAVQFDPEVLALKVCEPACPQVAPPVTLHPAADGRLTQVMAGSLALDPLVTQGFLLAVDKDAGFIHGLTPGRSLPVSATEACPFRAATPLF